MALKILLADDSMTAQNMGKKILTEAGYDIIAVSNGAAALKKIAELKPDIAILDVFMPGYTGPEVCERIKNVHETSKIPVLLTVGKMEMTAFKPEETNRVKADGLIIKPFEATDLIAVIQKLEKKVTAAPPKPLPTAFESDDETPQYEKTVKLDLREFRDASYDEWKTNAEEHTDEQPTKKPSATVPSEMMSAPAFVMEEAPTELRSTQVLEKGQTVMIDAPGADYAATIQVSAEAAKAATVPDWAVAPSQSARAAEISAAAEIPASDLATESSRESGVGKLLSKAKTWFGGATQSEAPAAEVGESIAAEIPAPSAMQEEIPPPTMMAEIPTPAGHDTQPLAPEEMTPPSFEAESAPDFSMPVGMTETAPSIEVPLEAVAIEPAREIEALTPHPMEVEHIARETVQISHATDPALDLSMHRDSHADVPVEVNPDLDTSMHRDGSEVSSHGLDPALVTDPSEMASAFPTNFGLANATIDPVGVAADVPGLYDDHATEMAASAEVEAPTMESVAEAAPVDATPVEEPNSGWRAEEHHLEDHEHGVRLEHEMAKHYEAQAAVAEPEPAAEVEEEAPAAPAAQTNAPDIQFAAAMAAAVGAEMPPANPGDNTAALDPEMIARVVQRVTERMRPELIAEITKELMKEKEKK
ncbi:MAG: response regulator [Terriglobales bacterium]